MKDKMTDKNTVKIKHMLFKVTVLILLFFNLRV